MTTLNLFSFIAIKIIMYVCMRFRGALFSQRTVWESSAAQDTRQYVARDLRRLDKQTHKYQAMNACYAIHVPVSRKMGAQEPIGFDSVESHARMDGATEWMQWVTWKIAKKMPLKRPARTYMCDWGSLAWQRVLLHENSVATPENIQRIEQCGVGTRVPIVWL